MGELHVQLPNLIPLGARAIKRILAAVEPLDFDRVYGAFHPMDLVEDGCRQLCGDRENVICARSHRDSMNCRREDSTHN